MTLISGRQGCRENGKTHEFLHRIYIWMGMGIEICLNSILWDNCVMFHCGLCGPHFVIGEAEICKIASLNNEVQMNPSVTTNIYKKS